MLTNLGKISFSNLSEYQNTIINDITQSIEYYAIGDMRKALPIRYLKLQQSDNTDDETSVMQKLYNSTFYAYHLTPVLENQMITPVLQDDETKQGITSFSQGEMVMLAISKPIPGDLFNFYIKNHQGLKDSEPEIFKITDVQFMRTQANLNLYRIQYETAPITESKLLIPKAFFWYNDFRRFYSIKFMGNMQNINSQILLKTINKYYRPEWSIVYDFALTQEVNLKLNKVLLFIKYKEPSNSTNIPLILLNGFDPSKIVEPYIISTTDENYIGFQREDVWYPNPDFIFDPNVTWDWTNDKLPNELAKAVWDLMENYKPFIFYKELDRSQETDVNLSLYQDVEINHFADKLKTQNNNSVVDLENIYKGYDPNEGGTI